MESVAVLGTGIMGAAMARRLLAAGHPVTVWNRSPEKAEPLAAAGAAVAETPQAAVRDATVVMTMLAHGDAVAAVMDGPDGALAAMGQRSLWLQTSTVGDVWADRFGELAGSVTYVDAPVLGTREPAERGELLVLAAGPDDVRDRCAPIFEAVGKRTQWVGAAGAASRLKLVVNAWLVGLVEALAESIALAEALDLAPQQFLDAIEGGPVGAPYAQLKGQAMMARSFPPSFPLTLALKDARLVVDAAERRGIDAKLARTVVEQFARAADAGHGDEDMAAVFRVVTRDS